MTSNRRPDGCMWSAEVTSAARESLRSLLTYVAYPNWQLFSDMINSASIFKPREHILGALAKLRTTTISFARSVCPSVCPHGTTRLQLDGFSRNLIFEYFFRKSLKKIEDWLTLNKNITGPLHEEEYTFLITSRSVLRMKNVSDKICREIKNTHFILKNVLSKIVPFVG